MSDALYLLFLQGAALGALAALLPGPDILLVLRSGVRDGRGVALRCTAGIGAGLLIYAALTLVFAATTLQWDLRPLQLAGAGYLIYLGTRLLCARDGDHQELLTQTLGKPDNAKSRNSFGFQLGFLSAVTNPKLMIWFGSVVLQLVGDNQRLSSRVAILTGMVVGPLVCFACLSLVSASLRQWVTARSVTWLDRVTGGLLIALALAGLFRHADTAPQPECRRLRQGSDALTTVDESFPVCELAS